MNLTINDELRAVPDGTTVAQLLEQLGLADKFVAVERNRTVVSFRLFSATVLADGDVLEIVTLVGGG